MGLVTMRIACLPLMWSLLSPEAESPRPVMLWQSLRSRKRNCGYAGGGERGKADAPVIGGVDTVATGLVVTDSVPSAVAGGNAAVAASDYWTPVIDELAAFGEDASNAASQTWWKIFLLGFLGGLVALLTPCVWPIIR